MRFNFILIAIMIMFSATALADDCQGYVDQAQTNTIYPNYLSAAGEFQLAAQCYAKAGDGKLATDNYKSAADMYVLGAEALINSGDYAQKAKSYESAADDYVQIGSSDLALSNYNMAKRFYVLSGRISDSESVQLKIDAMTKDTVPIVPILYDILIIAAVLVLGFIGFKAYKKFKSSDVRGFSAPSYDQPIIRRSADQFKSNAPPVRDEPVFRQRNDSAKQRAIQKLRDKYAP